MKAIPLSLLCRLAFGSSVSAERCICGTDLIKRVLSMGSIMGKMVDRICNDNCSSSHLLCSVLLHDFNGMIFGSFFVKLAYTHAQSVQLNFWSFAIIFIASAVVLNYWIRFRYLNIYSQLKEPPLVKPDANELHPDVNTTDPPPAFHNYLDDFLQAVRVFGFLEKPVSYLLKRYHGNKVEGFWQGLPRIGEALADPQTNCRR